MVSKTKQEAFDLLDFFFEDDIMLLRFMEYFNTFNLEVDSELCKKNIAERKLLDGVGCDMIAEELEITYLRVWKIKDRLLKSGLMSHMEKE